MSNQEKHDEVMNGQNEGNQHEIQKPFLFPVQSKLTPIGLEYHQVQVPPFIEHATPPPSHQAFLQSLKTELRPKPSFLINKTELPKLESFLNFVEAHFQEKIPQYFSLVVKSKKLESYNDQLSIIDQNNIVGSASKERMRAQACEFLHQMDYNYTRAKFFIYFPYYLAYNRYRCHKPLEISDEEMEKKIKDHTDCLKNTKQKDLIRWIGTVQDHIQSKVSLGKLNNLIEIARQNKYQIPQTIKLQIESAVKAGKEFRKALQNRMTIDKLRKKRQQLDQYKIVTPQMIHFQQTVNRCEQWIKKQLAFEQKYFNIPIMIDENQENGTVSEQFELKNHTEKIQFKLLQTLFNEYNNLPLDHKNYNRTTKKLYQTTSKIAERLQPLIKMSITRTANPTKFNYKAIRQLLDEIQNHPVDHQDFQIFQSKVSEWIQLLEKIGMFLEDEKSEKTVKTINNYLKLVSEIPIKSDVSKKLQSRLQYYDLMEKIKKDIQFPQKFDQVKDSIKKLKDKGFQSADHANFVLKIMHYMNLCQSLQFLNEDRNIPTLTDLIRKQTEIKSKLVDYCSYLEQKASITSEQNKILETIPKEVLNKFNDIEYDIIAVREILSSKSTTFKQRLELLQKCINKGFSYPQFQQLYKKMITQLSLIAKIMLLLDIFNSDVQNENPPILTKKQSEQIFYATNSRSDFRQLKTREGAQDLLRYIENNEISDDINECKQFYKYMKQDDQKREKVKQLIEKFKNDDPDVKCKDIIEQSKKCLFSKSVQEQINRIEIVMKWREKILKKLLDTKENIFNEKHKDFITKLKVDMKNMQTVRGNKETIMSSALAYMQENSMSIKQLLRTIVEGPSHSTHKISQLNKFCKEIDKEIDRYNLTDNKILEFKNQLHEAIRESQEWKENFLFIKRFEEKKIRDYSNDNTNIKQQQNNGSHAKIQTPQEVNQRMEVQNGQDQDQNQEQYSKQNEKKINVNGQFYWFYKIILLLIQYYQGYHLKFSLEDLVKLKSTFVDVYKLITHYDLIINREDLSTDPTDLDMEFIENQCNRVTLFLREGQIIKAKMAYLNSWKQLAKNILISVPIINMELKARNSQQLVELLNTEKQQRQSKSILENQQRSRINPDQSVVQEEKRAKRKLKKNPKYVNQDMTLITDEALGTKNKKRKKGANIDSQYRNTSVSSKKRQLQSQRASVILTGGDIPIEIFGSEDPKEYCICRCGQTNQNSVMVQCQAKCEEWYHIQCVGIKKNQTKGDIVYTCVGCQALYGLPPTDNIGVFFWDTHKKMSQNAFNQILQEGKQLRINTNQLRKLQLVNKKIMEWERNAMDLIQRIIADQQDLRQPDRYQNELYGLFLQSLWLPTAHPQSNVLKKMILVSRGQYQNSPTNI